MYQCCRLAKCQDGQLTTGKHAIMPYTLHQCQLFWVDVCFFACSRKSILPHSNTLHALTVCWVKWQKTVIICTLCCGWLVFHIRVQARGEINLKMTPGRWHYKNRSSVSLHQEWTSFVKIQLSSSYLGKSINGAPFFSPRCILSKTWSTCASSSQNNFWENSSFGCSLLKAPRRWVVEVFHSGTLWIHFL